MKDRSRYLLLFTLVAAILVVVVPEPLFAEPIVVFSNFGSAGEYLPDFSYGLAGPGLPDQQLLMLAVGFVPATSVYLDSIGIAVSLLSGPNQLDAWIATDAAPFYGPSSIVLESFSFTEAMGPAGFSNPILKGASSLQPVLNAGQLYWLVLRAGDGTLAAWNQNALGQVSYPFSAQSNSGDVGSWQLHAVGAVDLTPAFSVTGTQVVPESSTLILLLVTGLAAMVGKFVTAFVSKRFDH